MLLLLTACEPSFDFDSGFGHDGRPSGTQNPGDRDYNQESRNVLLLYSAGFNSLSDYLKGDIGDLMSGDLPSGSRNDDVLLVYSHLTARRGVYDVPNPPVLMHIYKGADGLAKADTLMTYPASTVSASASQLNTVLTYVRDRFPAKTYGMIFSSHATGYLPLGYYSNPESLVYGPAAALLSEDAGAHLPVGVPYVEPESDPSLPAVKSVGQDQQGVYGNYVSFEIQIEEFARALPMYLDYILFDACFMGGVEVAYELKDKCGMIGFSQTEVLAEGFDYKRIPMHLLSGGEPDLRSVCQDYFLQYDVQSGVYRSATVSLVDCSRLEPLAEVCAGLFKKYRSGLNQLDPTAVQRYFRGSHHWFYDLFDIIASSYASADDLKALNRALDDCIVYKAATPEFMEMFTIDIYSGLSMYLPCNGGEMLDGYYRTLKWNEATGLVQ